MEEPRDELQLEGGVTKEVREFCYVSDLMDSEGGVERAVTMRVLLRGTSGGIFLV